MIVMSDPDVSSPKCRKEIDELIKRIYLSSADKEAVLGGNARRFYGAPGV
jgi:hypothetical protein